MIKIKLIHDKIEQIKDFPSGITILDAIKLIDISILKKTIAVRINDIIESLYKKLEKDSVLCPILIDENDALDIIRHTTAHIMAEAVKCIFENVSLAIGPVIKDGFYYDFDIDRSFNLEDLELIENKMNEIIEKNESIIPIEIDRNSAIELFKKNNEKYKIEIIESINSCDKITIFKQGDFFDLCKGPHLPNTGRAKAFKLMRVAGAYWRGDSSNKMLQRIYGTAWRTKEELNNYLNFLEEVVKRDHRKIGSQCDLFHFGEEAVGQTFWHARGYTMYKIIESYIRDKISSNGYIEVRTPIVLDRSLWEKSGHWEKFKENMLITESEKKVLALKPMNCPAHIQIFNNKTISYKDLPIRMAEFGMCHRNESSGSLHGLMRVRGFTQDDAHIFCTEDQMEDEIKRFCILLKEVYADFGFNTVHVKFSDRPEKRAGTNETWDRAENILRDSVDKVGLEYTLNKGEGAFYGPKLEFVLKDAIGRDWQCGTLQVDLVLPERLGAVYIGKDGSKHHPIMLHRAILGTMERFIGILIEEKSGNMPLWIMPVQIVVVTISNESTDYAKEIFDYIVKNNLRAEIDLSDQTINSKIKKHSLMKIPIIVVIGVKEKETNTVSYRKIGSNYTKNCTIVELLNQINEVIKNKKDNIS